MDISDQNIIVRDTLKQALSTSLGTVRRTEEFGSYVYIILTQDTNVQFGFYCEDFDKLFDYALKDWITIEFPGIYYIRNSKLIDDFTYSIIFSINTEQFKHCFQRIPKGLSEEDKEKFLIGLEESKQQLNEYAENLSDKFSRFRTNIYVEVAKKYVREISSKTISPPIKAKINSFNTIYFIPDSEKLSIAFGMNFEQKTDNGLAKLFFRELDDAKFGFGGTIDVKYHNFNIPEFIANIDSDCKRYNAGFLAFSKSLIKPRYLSSEFQQDRGKNVFGYQHEIFRSIPHSDSEKLFAYQNE